MAKPREDLQTVAYRIDAIMRSGKTEALPIYYSIPERVDSERRPSVILHFGRFRRRFPPVYVASIARYEAMYEKPWDNRVTIGPCVFNRRNVRVTRRSPDWDWLLSASKEERRRVGVFETSKGLQRGTYEIVEDLSHGLRQPIHIRSRHWRERSKLTQLQFELREKQRLSAAGFMSLTEQEKETADLTLAQIALRLTEINRITLDRLAREESIRSYAIQSNLHLFYLAQSLANFSGTIRRSGFVDRLSAEAYLHSFLADLLLFTSKEVRSYRNYAKLLLGRIIADIAAIETVEICRLLDKTVEHLTRAAVILSDWANNLPEDERNLANLTWTGTPTLAT